jgi:DNA-directed RNA polymerase specialized sigma24 family protein
MPQPAENFPPTQWSLIAAAREGSEADAASALNTLCHAYWQPLYVFARRRGVPPDEAPDFVQEFLSDFIERGILIRSDPQRGRFRSFLLTAFQNYLTTQRRKQLSEKRGGRVDFVELGEVMREEEWQAGMSDAEPERAFDLRWAEAVMHRAMNRVQGDYERAGNKEIFDAMRPALFGEKIENLKTLGRRFGMTTGGAGAAVFRLRTKFRTVLRDEVGQTVAEQQEVDGEIHYLLSLLAR